MEGMLEGKSLYDLLVKLTGLDQKIIERELSTLIHKLEIDVDCLRHDDLKRIALLYLDQVQGELFAASLRGNSEDWAEA